MNLIQKRYLVTLILLIPITSSFFFWETYKNKSTSCVELRDGTISVEIRYPDDFVERTEITQIRVLEKGDLKKNKENALPVFHVISKGYMPLETIVRASLTDLGPVYATTTFNGYQAAHGRVEDGSWISDYYEIPIGNRTVYIAYNRTRLSGKLKLEAEKILEDISIVEKKDDIEGAYTKDCKGRFWTR